MPFEIRSWAEEAGAPKNELEERRGFNPQAALEDLLSLPVFIKNDAGAACSAEMSFGNLQNYNSFLYIFVGTFLGGGLVLNNQLVNGKTGNAGGRWLFMPFTNGSTQSQLITQSSLYLLERKLNDAGHNGQHIYESPSHWSCDTRSIEDWLSETARGLAFATQCAMSLLDLDGVIIDGAIPDDVKNALVAHTQSAMETLDMRGLAQVHISEGLVGRKKRNPLEVQT